jgi:hypothetical protein
MYLFVAIATKIQFEKQYRIYNQKDSYQMTKKKDVVENTNIKKGRKPKGGKIIAKQLEISQPSTQSTNIILHLKCSLSDINNIPSVKLSNPLDYNPTIPPEIKTYNTNSFFMYKSPDTNDFAYTTKEEEHICKICKSKEVAEQEVAAEPAVFELDSDEQINIKDINHKLKNLKINMYKNTLDDKKSACFWCTYDFDNNACYIPKYEIDGHIYGYGSFCRPECAVAYLMKENIDDSQKFERYHLLNQIYSKVYQFKKNIKPAPNPYYLLDKFYGNLTIQEYRKLLKTEHMLLVIDKPLSRILPELHEDNESMSFNIYGTTTSINTKSTYRVKRQSEKQQGPSKSNIIRNNFGLGGSE